MNRFRVAIAGAVFLAGSAGVFASGQMPTQQTPTTRNPELPSIDGRNPDNSDALPPSVLARQAKMRNDARQQQMINDANKLAELAGELKKEMSMSGKNVDQDDVARKAAEIEKLAKSVKDHMKG